jgi:hypothetical protein
MPTIEFHGFSASSLDSILGEVTDAVRRNTFASEIVLVYGQGDQVVDLEDCPWPCESPHLWPSGVPTL